MKKVKLHADELEVESFALDARVPARGTVVGHGTGLPYDSNCCWTQYMECTYDDVCTTGPHCMDDPAVTAYCNTADCVTNICGGVDG